MKGLVLVGRCFQPGDGPSRAPLDGSFAALCIGFDLDPEEPSHDDYTQYLDEIPAINRNEDGCTYAYCAKRV